MKCTAIKRKTVISVHSKKLLDWQSTPATKARIQDLLWKIVQIRDGGCILRNVLGHTCNGFALDGHLILQADHLITRTNSATYADSRLVVCICKGAHPLAEGCPRAAASQNAAAHAG